jgi:hypothetical protein
MQQPAGRKFDFTIVFGQQPQPRIFHFQYNRTHDFLMVDILNDAP